MLLLLSLACVPEPATYYYGDDLTELAVVPIDWDEGVYPNTSVLDDPANPFVDGIGQTKWDVLSTDCMAGFYAFATAQTEEGTGENQYYTSSCLQSLYDADRIAAEDTYWAWSAAVRGYQVVLDTFPDSVTYDATGTIPYELAPLAFRGIESLGAVPEGWVEVLTSDGTSVIVQESQ